MLNLCGSAVDKTRAIFKIDRLVHMVRNIFRLHEESQLNCAFE